MEYIEKSIDEVFYVNSGTRITDEQVYSNSGEIPIITSQTKNETGTWYASEDWLRTFKRKDKSFYLFEGKECLTWAKEGYAGKMFYRDYIFFPIDVCGVLTLKEEWVNKVDLKWFYHTQQQLLYKYVYSKGGQGKLYEEPIKRIKFKFPKDINYQRKIIEKYEKITSNIRIIENKIKLILDLQNNKVTSKFESKEELGKIFQILGGNSGLTEELIYNNPPIDDKDKLPIFSGSNDSKPIGFISFYAKLRNKHLKIFNSPAIIISRKGKAGNMKIVDYKSFTINDDAYVMILKKEWKNKICLEWFLNNHQSLFYNLVTSKSDNGTFNKDYAKRQIVEVPNYKSSQKDISSKIILLESKLNELITIRTQLYELLRFDLL